MNKKFRNIIIVLIVIVILGLIFLPKIKPEIRENESTQAIDSQPTLPVDVIITEKEKIYQEIKVTGSLSAGEEVNLKSEISGIISEIHFREGQKVNKGKVLFTIIHDELLAQIKKQEHLLDLNRNIEERQQKLLDKEAISQEEYETALTNVRTIDSEIELLKARLEKHFIKAPFNEL